MSLNKDIVSISRLNIFALFEKCFQHPICEKYNDYIKRVGGKSRIKNANITAKVYANTKSKRT
jgi:hypothetical protein